MAVGCGNTERKPDGGGNSSAGGPQDGSNCRGECPANIDTTCPAVAPEAGRRCAGDLVCTYVEAGVDSCEPQPHADCIDSHWSVYMAPVALDCGSHMPPGTFTCPATPPQVGTPCFGFQYCEYPNTTSTCPPVEGRSCRDGFWSFAGPLILCPGEGGQAGTAGQPGFGGEGPGGAGEGPGAGGDSTGTQGGAGGAP